MTASLEGSRAKFSRARAQMKALNKEIAGFVDERHPVRFEGQFYAEEGVHRTRAYVLEHPDWIEWGLMLGDAIQNARASLDHAVRQLVILSRNDPRKHRTQFPICSTGERYWCKTKDGRPSTRDRDLSGVAEEYRAIIDDAQPYRARHAPEDHALSGLADLSNVDKHQVIHAGFFAIGDPYAYVVDAVVSGDVGELIELEVHSGAFQEDTDVVTARPDFTGPHANVKMDIQIPVDIAFGKRGYTLHDLAQILDAVEIVLDDLNTVF